MSDFALKLYRVYDEPGSLLFSMAHRNIFQRFGQGRLTHRLSC